MILSTTHCFTVCFIVLAKLSSAFYLKEINNLVIDGPLDKFAEPTKIPAFKYAISINLSSFNNASLTIPLSFEISATSAEVPLERNKH